MKTQSSPRSETIAERATLVAYPWRSTTVKGRGVQRGLAITLVDLEQLTDGGAPRARRNSWGCSTAPTGRQPRVAPATTWSPRERGESLHGAGPLCPPDPPPDRLASGRHASCAAPCSTGEGKGPSGAPETLLTTTNRPSPMRRTESQPILVVEDDEDLRHAMLELLRGFGRGAIGAANGQQALGILRRGIEPCVILLDLMMPGMDGWTFRREQMRDRRLSRIPVIVVSADSDPLRGGSLLGADVLSKPLNFDRLLALLERLSPPPSVHT
ncbi:MAG: response regulator [Deltaproteobacteria bacterium]|nr:MAG: response regulator [Deltaproteobacteria bacterium]